MQNLMPRCQAILAQLALEAVIANITFFLVMQLWE